MNDTASGTVEISGSDRTVSQRGEGPGSVTA